MSEKKHIETDILCVGAGVASLSTALSLLRTLKKQNVEKLPRVTIIEKGRNVGSHVLSGAVIDPSGFDGILTPEEIQKIPIEAKVKKEAFHMLSESASLPIPWMPRMMHAEGFPVGSLTKLVIYLADLCEKEGAEVYTGFAAAELLEDSKGRVIGVKTGPKGVGRDSKKKSNYLEGEEVYAKTVVLGEGASGFLTKRLLAQKDMFGMRRQSYALGIKEIVEVSPNPERVGEIMHTFGYPSDSQTYGGGFVYQTAPNQVMVGYVYALDYTSPTANPHKLFRRFKAHPIIEPYLRGGKIVAYGAKVIPEGGFFAVPEVYNDGVLIVGDGAGLVDSLRIKGVHIAMMSGRAAGETLANCWIKNDFSKGALQQYDVKLKETPGWQQLKRVKNVRASFSKGIMTGVMSAGFAWATYGAFPFWQVDIKRDFQGMKTLQETASDDWQMPITPLSPDRLTDVFMSGTKHEENQPCHLKILDTKRCIEECIPKYGAPCLLFCPARVYALEDDHIHVDFSNCLHCKTCQIKDPLQNIEWTLPQGGDGPRYTRM
ncbi:MAG: electron transfer flavoprotein-ubiquinone oxidoreductase [Verrucomicrobia bacterium]|nr:electron transfer flavoprotein-ubiquinone oxidoreductase [Verrucomicrobiota bacterium]